MIQIVFDYLIAATARVLYDVTISIIAYFVLSRISLLFKRKNDRHSPEGDH